MQIVGQAAQTEYREAVKRGEIIQGILCVTAFGIMVIVIIMSHTAGGASA